MSKTISGLILIALSQFFAPEEVETVLTAIGIMISWYGRVVASGDISIFGLKQKWYNQ